MVVFIALPTALIYLVALVYVALYVRTQSREAAERGAMQNARTYAARFDDYVTQAARVAEMTARFVESVARLDEREIYSLLASNVRQNRRVYGSAIAFEPGKYREAPELFCPYVYEDAEGLHQMNIHAGVVDWYRDEKWQWWHRAKRGGHGVWTDPYFDEGASNSLVTTFSAPFFEDGVFSGVATVDIDLPGLEHEIGSRIVGGHEFMILTQAGQIVVSPISSEIMTHTIFDILEEEDRTDLLTVAARIISGETEVLEIAALFGAEPRLVAYAPIPSTGWTFVYAIPASEATAAFRRTIPFVVLPFLGALVLIVTGILWVAGRLTHPVERLREKVSQISEGDLGVSVDVLGGDDEIGDLAKSFNRMTSDLRAHVQRLARVQSERERAEDANRAKSEFLSHMSHELRTPLNGILGYAQILQHDPDLTRRQAERIEAIVSCGDHLLALINDVLDLSRIEARRIEVDLAATDLAKLLRDVSDIVEQRAESKGLSYRVEVAPEVPRGVITDAAKLRQVLVNLLGNAVKFTAEGSVTLKVREEPTGVLQLDAIDTGIGIAPDELGFMFDPSTLVVAARAAGGTGRGLAIRGVLSASLGGSLEVESEEGEGSCFRVTLPFEECDLDEPPRTSPDDAEASSPAALAPGQRFRGTSLIEAAGHAPDAAPEAPHEEPPPGLGDTSAAFPDEVAERLRDALQIRNVTAILDIASELEEDPERAPAGRTIRALVQAFDFTGLARELDSMNPPRSE